MWVFDRRSDLIWLDGSSFPSGKISVLTHGLHYASCVFEGERAYGGEIFRGTEHSVRLKRSAQLMDFDIPLQRGSMLPSVSFSRRVIRRTRTSGHWPGAVPSSSASRRTTRSISPSPPGNGRVIRPGAAAQGHPARSRRVPSSRSEKGAMLAKAAGLYMICTISKHRAEKRGYADAMMLDWQGRVAECTGANIFFVKDGKIHTPIADCFLAGITRATAIALAHRHNIEVISAASCRRSCRASPSASSPDRRRRPVSQIADGHSRPAASPSN